MSETRQEKEILISSCMLEQVRNFTKLMVKYGGDQSMVMAEVKKDSKQYGIGAAIIFQMTSEGNNKEVFSQLFAKVASEVFDFLQLMENEAKKDDARLN